MTPTYELELGFAREFARLPWEMSWSGDGRAIFRYGSERKAGETHVVWLRVGGHEIFSRPQ
jgi:hypothetical protein